MEKEVAGLSSFLLSKEHLANDLGKNAFEAWQIILALMLLRNIMQIHYYL
ncbi:MAG: hypothetical protein JWR76_2194 [Mucilaginibacter sp.]|nr:hypothetical protein [Mucilaginibacter sp.]